MPQQANRTERIEARIAPAALRTVKRDAEEVESIRLSVDDQRRFVDLLLKPPALAPAMKRAKKAHARLIRSST